MARNMVRNLLVLLCLLIMNLTTTAHADEASDLLKRIETTVNARRPIIMEATLTIEFPNGKSTAKITCHASGTNGGGTSGEGKGQPDGTPVFWEVVPMAYINPLVPQPVPMPRPARQPAQPPAGAVGGGPAAVAATPVIRALGKEKIDGEEYDVVQITESPDENDRHRLPFSKADLKTIVRRFYIGQDGLIHRIRGESTWEKVDNQAGKKAVAAPTLQTSPFELVVNTYRKPITFAPRPDSQPPLKSIPLDPTVIGFNTAIATSPNGKLVAMATQDGDIHLLNSGTGKEQSSLTGHISQVMALAFSPDGKRLVSADSLAVAVWDVDAGKLLYTLRDQPGVSGLLVMPDSKSMLVVGNNGKAQLRNLAKGQSLRTLDMWLQAPFTLSPDGNYLATPTGGQMRLINMMTWQSLPVETGASPFMCRAVFSPDGSRLAAGGMDGAVHLVDGRTGRKVRDLTGAAGRINAVWFSADGKQITALDSDNRGDLPTGATGATTWDIMTGQVTQSLSLNGGTFIQPGFGQSMGNTFLVGNQLAQFDQFSHSIKLWALPLMLAAH